MQTKRYEFLLEATSPIAHHEETMGNTAVFMRRKVRQHDGSWARVAYITGDTMRHGLREAGAYAFLDAAGLLEDHQLSAASLRLLFSGGMVTGRGNAAVVNLDRFREMCELCPTLALFGGCSDNRVIPGRMFVDEATLVCAEQAAYLPEWVKANTSGADAVSQREALEEVQRVRMDPSLNTSMKQLLSPDSQVEVVKQLAASESAHTEDDAITRDDSKSTMMPRRFERLAQGSLFHWTVTANCFSDLDVDTLHVVIGAFLANCRVGGKRGTGHGSLRCVMAKDIPIVRPKESGKIVDVTDLGGRVGSLFISHVQERKERIAKWLTTINA